MHKMKQTNELQASLDFASRSEEAENSCKQCTRPQIPISRGHVWGPMAENSLHGYQTCKQEILSGEWLLAPWLGKVCGPSATMARSGPATDKRLPWALPEAALAPEC